MSDDAPPVAQAPARTGTFAERFPEWVSLPTHQLLARIPNQAFHALVPVIAEWYEMNLPLWRVLQHFGYDGQETSGGPRRPYIGPGTTDVQVSCRLPTHPSFDIKPSARYYVFDRNKNTSLGHIFCFAASCYKAYTSFWYAYVMLKHHIEADFRETIRYLEEHPDFKVPFPRHAVLQADPDKLDDASRQMAVQKEIAQRMLQARMLRERYMSGEIERSQHLAALSLLHTQPLVCMSVEAP